MSVYYYHFIFVQRTVHAPRRSEVCKSNQVQSTLHARIRNDIRNWKTLCDNDIIVM